MTVKAADAGVTAQSFSLSPNGPGDYVVPVTINVTDISETPQFPADTATRKVAENSGGEDEGGSGLYRDGPGTETRSTTA